MSATSDAAGSSAPSTDGPPGGGNGRGGNRRWRKNRDTGGGGGSVSNLPPFLGSTLELNGNVFECHGERATRPQYRKTLEALQSYIKIRMPFPEDQSPLFQNAITAVTLQEPARPGKYVNQVDFPDYKIARARYDKHEETLVGNLAALFALIWDSVAKAKVKSSDDWTTSFSKNDCYWLLQQIKAVIHQFDKTPLPVAALIDARVSFLTYRQQANESVESFMDILRAWAEVIEGYGGSIAETPTPLPDASPFLRAPLAT